MQIKVGNSSNSKIKVTTRISTPENLNAINNISIENVKDGYVLMYDEKLKQYKFVDPDTVFTKAVENSSDLPQGFVDKIDEDLDNRIDIDAGEF